MAAKTTSAVVPQTLTPDQLTELLAASGMAPKASEGGGFHRMSLRSGVLVTDPGQPNEETWPMTKRGPVMTVRIVKPPVYFNAHFLSTKPDSGGAINPNLIGRPDLDNKFVKKYDDPAEQAADSWANLDAYEAVYAMTGNRGSFKADIQLQIMPESGEFTGEEPIYTLTLPGTSALDFRGTSRDPIGGVAQEKNFIVQLGEFAQQKAIEEGNELAQAVLDAMTALRLGGVVAEVYLSIQQSEKNPQQSWTVVSFKPIHVETGSGLAALTAGGEEDDLSANSDDIPF